MSSRRVRQQQLSQRPPAGASCEAAAALSLIELQEKRREEEELKAALEEREQMLERLHQRIEKLRKDHQKEQELHLSFDAFLKDEAVDQTVEKAERERKEALRKEEEIEKLKEERAELMEAKHKLDCQVQRHTVYRDIMEQVVKVTKFEGVESVGGHLESLVHFRDQLCQRESQAQEQLDQQRKALVTLEDQHHLLQLQKNNQLSQLQTELEGTRSEALTWERKWSHIQETAAKKTLLLGQIKMATLNLHEMTGGNLEGDESVDMNDTEKQLDKIRMFIQDHEDIVKQHQTHMQRHCNGQKRDRGKKRHTTHSKKQ